VSRSERDHDSLEEFAQQQTARRQALGYPAASRKPGASQAPPTLRSTSRAKRSKS
jgi:hypothetical protein